MSRKKKKITKGKKKFFIILACYVATFVLTSVITMSTMSWFNSSTWQSEIMYMGGPVYIHFSDDSGITHTSGQGQLVTKTPPGWEKLYPGMNISFEARAVIEGAEFNKVKDWGETVTYYTTEAVLRAKISLEVKDPNGATDSKVATDIYGWIWPQLKNSAIADTQNDGVWIFDPLESAQTEEENYFYYCVKGQNEIDTGDYELVAVGGIKDNVTVGFLNNAIIQMPPIDLTNEHADCLLKFTIVFEAVQAFLPYEQSDIDNKAIFQGDNSGRLVEQQDLGLAKPLIIKNSRKVFNESRWTPENGYQEATN